MFYMQFKCERVYEVWGPHDGCKEFMSEPDTFICGQPGVYRVTYMQESMPCEENPLGIPYFGAEHLCKDCMKEFAREMNSTPQWFPFYSYSITYIGPDYDPANLQFNVQHALTPAGMAR